MLKRPFSRRSFFQASALVGGSLAAGQALATEIAPAAKGLPPGGTLLFQGDSITDAGRDRKQTGPNAARALGYGYPLVIASKLLADYPQLQLKAYNRGISGHKVPDLDKRWQRDCLDLKPDVLSILIGVNDIWHKLNGNYDGTVDSYERGLHALLSRTRSALPKTRIVVCEPFVLRCGAVNERWFPEFDQRRAACKRVADAMACSWVPLQRLFDEATQGDIAPNYWAADGVHPTVAGHGLIANAWLSVLLAERAG